MTNVGSLNYGTIYSLKLGSVKHMPSVGHLGN